MAKERLKSPRARLFVALDLPEAVRTGIAAWGRRELVDPAQTVGDVAIDGKARLPDDLFQCLRLCRNIVR